MALSVYDLSVVASIAILIATAYLFVRWRKLNAKMAWSFLLFGLAGIPGIAINYYQISGDTGFFLRSLILIGFMFFLSYGLASMMKGSKPLFYVYLLSILVPIAYLLSPSISFVYTSIGMLYSIVNTTFFTFLFLEKTREVKIIAFIGIVAMFLSGIFTVLLGKFDTPQPFYISRLLLAFVFIGLAHLSVHAPNHIYNVDKRRKRR